MAIRDHPTGADTCNPYLPHSTVKHGSIFPESTDLKFPLEVRATTGSTVSNSPTVAFCGLQAPLTGTGGGQDPGPLSCPLNRLALSRTFAVVKWWSTSVEDRPAGYLVAETAPRST